MSVRKPRENHPASPSVALIGLGYWGPNLTRNFHALGALATICDADPSRQALAATLAPHVPFVTSFAAALARADVRAVAIATPAATHYELARQALEAGKDVFVEKPMALTVSDGQALVDLAARHGRILMVGHILRYHPAIVRLGQLIREGGLGRMHYLYSNRLNIGKIRTEENILWSFAPHDISVMLALLGEEPVSVSCEGGAYLRPNIPDVTVSQLTFPSGVRGHIHVSWLHPFKEQRLVVVGSEKMAVFDDSAKDKLLLYPHKVAWRDRVPTAVKADAERVDIDDAEPLSLECRHFLECLESRQTPRTDGAEGLRVLKVLSACQTALSAPAAPSPLPAPGAPTAPFFRHPTAAVDEGARVGAGSKIWHFAHIQKGAQVGTNCIIGQNVNVDGGAVLGNNVKVQNNVSVYSGVTVEDDAFLGPSCVLTNVSNPRSQINRHALYEQTLVRRGATIGANATILCGVTLGRYAFVGAGSVVTRDVPDYGLVLGNPAKRAGWMSRHGQRLRASDDQGIMTCPESGYRYREVEPGVLRCLDLDEEAPLPQDQRLGRLRYDAFKD
ncbi:MAG: Gfo/Idh/MocA family oxidoreductase [Lentisphaerae bacterium]|nr:Gfo/Idh/MocA family oxidoreductase [Lentisphaerota bacterium]